MHMGKETHTQSDTPTETQQHVYRNLNLSTNLTRPLQTPQPVLFVRLWAGRVPQSAKPLRSYKPLPAHLQPEEVILDPSHQVVCEPNLVCGR